jgi:hypothetical protein
MKLLLSCMTYFGIVTAGYAATCSTGSFDFNAPGLAMGPLHQKIVAVFPTYRDLLLSEDELAVLWIDPTDCGAPDLDARAAKVEAIVGRKVILRAATVNYRLIAAYRYPEIVRTRKLKKIFPSMTLRGDKIGENVEVLLVKAIDFHADDTGSRQARAAAIVGRPVELLLSPF